MTTGTVIDPGAETKQALARQEQEQLDSPLPVFRGPQMAQALVAYKELQTALDASMPDAIMTLDGKPYRKKSYWRAVAVAFNLSVDVVSERREVYGVLEDGTENYAWMVTCRASSPKGRSETGDGACAAAEKQKGRMKATEHNVRSHAHTRAFNRAVSNLVGFGEVSAEEVDRDEHATGQASPAMPHAPAPKAEKAADGSVLVTEVKPNSGTGKSGKPWKNWRVTFDDGTYGTTFDEGQAADATRAKADGRRVIVELQQDGKFTNLLGIRFAELQQAVVVMDTEPIGQPEKVLSTRAANTEPGKPPYWFIQTDRREYVTNLLAVVESAEQLRASGEKALVAFEVLPGPHPRNKVTEFGAAPQADLPL